MQCFDPPAAALNQELESELWEKNLNLAPVDVGCLSWWVHDSATLSLVTGKLIMLSCPQVRCRCWLRRVCWMNLKSTQCMRKQAEMGAVRSPVARHSRLRLAQSTMLRVSASALMPTQDSAQAIRTESKARSAFSASGWGSDS